MQASFEEMSQPKADWKLLLATSRWRVDIVVEVSSRQLEQ